MTPLEMALEWAAEQDREISPEELEQTINAITYELQHRHDYDE